MEKRQKYSSFVDFIIAKTKRIFDFSLTGYPLIRLWVILGILCQHNAGIRFFKSG